MSSKEIRKICGNCTSFEKPILECLQGKCHYFSKQIVDRFALEDACVSFAPMYDCKFCINYECECPGGSTISDDELTAAGFLPMCKSYEEMGGGEDGN